MPMRKSWTWVGGFGPDVMLCAAVARVGPAALIGGQPTDA